MDNCAVVSKGTHPLKLWAKSLRFHQWIKNILIFVPLFASHRLDQPQLIINAILAFLFFGLCASSAYLLNDIIDQEDDRLHKTKRNRPFASGQLPVKYGIIAFPLLLVVAFGGALLFLPWQFTVVLACYYVVTVLYSIYLKRLMMVDVIVLGGLYTLRLIAGLFAFGMWLTFWMLAFSMFLFLSLAMVKRYTELLDASTKGSVEKLPGRGYYPSDLSAVGSLGIAAGYLAVLVLALYAQEPSTLHLYKHPEVIWLSFPLLLYWISRIWILTQRGQMNDDPIVFAIKDRKSLIVGILFVIIFWCAT